MTAFPSYSTGTVVVNPGDTAIVGTNTLWSGPNARPGDDIVIAGHTVVVQDVADATHLVIDAWPYSAVGAGTPYKIIQRSPLRFAGGQAMADVSTLVAALNTDGFYVFVGSALSVPDPSYGNDGQYAYQASTGKLWLKQGGAWTFLYIISNVNFDSVPWSASTTYGQHTIVSYVGKLWLARQASTNQRPDLTPTYWQLLITGGDAYDVVTFDTDRPASGELVLKLVFTKNVTFYSGLADSMAKAEAAATSSSVYSYRKNGTEFATLTFGAASAAGVFTSAADTSFVPGDVLTVFAPPSRDATLSGVGATLSGYRT